MFRKVKRKTRKINNKRKRVDKKVNKFVEDKNLGKLYVLLKFIGFI